MAGLSPWIIEMNLDTFFLKAVPYALLLAGAVFMALLIVAMQTGLVLFGCCALLVLGAALFMARMVGSRLTSTKPPEKLSL